MRVADDDDDDDVDPYNTKCKIYSKPFIVVNKHG